jgi:hypothetical protein
VFAGSNWRGGTDEVTVTIVPMLGVAFGTLRGVVPALEASLEWGAFDAYLEAEWFVDTSERSRSFVYAWSELGWTPGDGWRLGAVAQRSRRYGESRDVQRGLFVQREIGWATLGVFAFEPADPSRRLVLLMVGAGF